MKLLKITIALLLLLGLGACTGKKSENAVASDEMFEDAVKIQIVVKDYGTVEAELYPKVAPKTVENFVTLVEKGIYENNTFHRIIDGFMIQGGMDRNGQAEKIEGEFASNGFENNLKHKEGVISMARDNDPNSASSQFFIMVGDGDWLDGQYAAFGKVTSGLEIVKKIAKDAKPIDNKGTIPEEEQPIIENIVVVK